MREFDAALPRVTRLATWKETFQRAPGLVIRQRLSNVKHVQFDVNDSDLGSSLTNAVYLGKQLASLKLSVFKSDYLDEDDSGEYVPQIEGRPQTTAPRSGQRVR